MVDNAAALKVLLAGLLVSFRPLCYIVTDPSHAYDGKEGPQHAANDCQYSKYYLRTTSCTLIAWRRCTRASHIKALASMMAAHNSIMASILDADPETNLRKNGTLPS